MADGKKGGSPGNLQSTMPLNMTIPASTHQYLTWLATNTMWGPTIQDVVLKIITPKLHELFDGGYHNKRLPDVVSAESPKTGESD